jgi:hypothetical protein
VTEKILEKIPKLGSEVCAYVEENGQELTLAKPEESEERAEEITSLLTWLKIQ